jgi:two-component system heavy metal sensor histidine kinase CusS
VALTGEGPATVAVTLMIDHHRAFMHEFRRTLWIAIALSAALAALLGWVAARRGLVPVRAMAEVTHRISATRLTDRVAIDTLPSELVDLGTAFNAMLVRLEEAFTRLSEFSSDLAHELRTPVSTLMTQTQVAVSRARSADEYREILYANLEEFDRLARTIGDMLFLAKADNGLMVPRREPFELVEEVRQLFDFYEALAEEQGVRLDVAGSGRIEGDRLMIRRALSNLVSNALRHSPRGQAVRVTIDRPDGRHVRVIVHNRGEPIAPEHLERIFVRFYRVDPARQHGSQGAGLGLAITRSIVEAHRGRIAVESDRDGTRFVLIFPAAQELERAEAALH